MMRHLRLKVNVSVRILIIGIAFCCVPTIADENAVIAVPADVDDVTVDNEDENSEEDAFIPSDEWQKIKPGQAIPAGLHVKLNLETGEKEAKFLEKGKISGHHYELQDTDDQGTARGKGKQFSPQELKEALKKFKTEEIAVKVDKQNGMKTKFRSIDELKKEFQHLKLNVKSESEMLMDLISRYSTATQSNKYPILQDMEYLVHQYDTAQDFVKLRGLPLLMPDLNSTDSKVREMVAFVMGSAMQGNPQVQIAVLEQNAMQKLLRLVAFDASTLVRARALYAISCLVRQFPFAQRRLVENGGLSIFAQLFDDSRPEMQILQLKVVVLLHDLVTEQQLALKYSKKIATGGKDKTEQYSQLDILTPVVENNFCELVPQLLPSPDYDTQEKVMSAMLTLVHACRNKFLQKLPALRQLAESYGSKLAKENDEYIASLHQIVTDLLSKVTSRDEL